LSSACYGFGSQDIRESKTAPQFLHHLTDDVLSRGWIGCHGWDRIQNMGRKIPAIVVLAAFTTEVVAGELQHDVTHSQPHTETGVNCPANMPIATMSGGPGRAMSATLTLTPTEDRLRDARE
jgi:hypothetical protein